MDKFLNCLKKVHIKNFLTYSKLELENFDLNINLIIGVNGSGKTSFFKAIEFTLTKNFKYDSNLFDKLCNEKSIKELQVTIVLNNNTTFSRKLTNFNEQYFINDELIIDTYYFNILEYFHLNNFCLFPQGQLNNYINSSEKLKKELIKLCLNKNKMIEIYDIIEFASNYLLSTQKISSDILFYLEKNQENSFLEKRKELENDIEIAKFMISEKKINYLEEELKNKKNEYQKISEDLVELSEKQKENEILKSKESLSQSSVINLFKNEQDLTPNSIGSFDLNYNEFKLQLELNEFKDQLEREKKVKVYLNKNYEEISKTIENKQNEFQKISYKLDQLLEKENSLIKEISLKKFKIENLYSENITNPITETEQLEKIKKIESSINEIKQNILKLKDQKEVLEKKNNNFKNNIFQSQKEIKEINFDLIKTENDVSKNQNERRNLQKKIGIEEKIIATYEEIRNNLNFVLGQAIMLGKENMDCLINKFKTGTDLEKTMVENYYGFFIDNIKFDQNFLVAIERTSYSYLHKHIVKDLKTANFFLKQFNLQKMKGICEFVVIDLLNNDETKLDENNQLYKPLIKCVAYEKNLEKVIKNCFKFKYICRSIKEVFYLNKKFDFVTLDGDLLFKNKTMNGGYINKKNLWIKNYEKYKSNQSKLKSHVESLNSLKKDLSNFELGVENNIVKINQLEQAKIKKKSDSFDFSTNLKNNEFEMKNINNSIEKIKDALSLKKEELELEKQKLSHLKEHVKFITSVEKHNLIAILQKDIKDLKIEFNSMKEYSMKIKTEHQSLKLDLEENLYKQQVDLKNKIAITDLELINLQKNIENLQLDSNSSRKVSDELNNSSISKTSSKELNSEEEENSQSSSIEQMNFKITQLRLKLDNNIEVQENYKKKINSIKSQITSIPKKIKFKSFTIKKLFRKLEECQKELETFKDENNAKSINFMIEKKYEIYNDELDEFKEIFNLVNDMFKKNLNWSKLFKNLSAFIIYFRDFFKNFVDNGEIFIEMTLPNNSLDEKILLKNMCWTKLSPVLKISFDGEFPKKVDNLSGGQKTIVSLCFLLAKLLIEPSPFLLFDETDQNLDESTCHKLGEILKSTFKEKNQFFFSSNRTYFANFADKVFRVMAYLKSSVIKEVELDYWSSQESKTFKLPSLSSSNESQVSFTQLEERNSFDKKE